MMLIFINKLEKLSDKEIELMVSNLEEIHRDLTDEDSKKTCEMLIDIVESEMGLNEEIGEYFDSKFIYDSYELLCAEEEDKRVVIQYRDAKKDMELSGNHIKDFVNAIYLLEKVTGKNALEGIQSLKYYVEKDEVFTGIVLGDDFDDEMTMYFEFRELNDDLVVGYSLYFLNPLLVDNKR